MPKYKVEFDGLVQSKQTNIILVGNESGKKRQQQQQKNLSAQLYTQDNCKSLICYSELLKLTLSFYSKQQKNCELAGSLSKASWLPPKVK